MNGIQRLSENRWPEGEESSLSGGTANIGRVKRRGGTVRRPAGSYTPAVHALLTHLAENGFTGCPRVVGVEGSTEILSYVDGVAAFQPGRPGTMLLPDWAQTDAAMVSVARLLRGFHDASATFDPTGWPWQRPVPDGWAGPRVTHNDTHPANLIFADGQAVGLIDFDLAGPGTVAFELAVAACFWIPIREDRDVSDARRGRMYERFRLFLEAYGADDDVREDVIRALVPANDWIFGIIRENAERGHPAFARMWALRADIATRALIFAENRKSELRAAVL